MLKFRKDQNLWLRWLHEAKKRFGLIILNYILTSNHIYMIAEDNGNGDIIPKSLGLKAKARKVEQVEASYLVREPIASYNALFEGKNMPLRAENTYLWDLSI